MLHQVDAGVVVASLDAALQRLAEVGQVELEVAGVELGLVHLVEQLVHGVVLVALPEGVQQLLEVHLDCT